MKIHLKTRYSDLYNLLLSHKTRAQKKGPGFWPVVNFYESMIHALYFFNRPLEGIHRALGSKSLLCLTGGYVVAPSEILSVRRSLESAKQGWVETRITYVSEYSRWVAGMHSRFPQISFPSPALIESFLDLSYGVEDD